MPLTRTSPRRRLDLAAIVLAPLGIAVVFVTQLFDGVSLGALLHPAAALIVFGGTLGAILISFSLSDVVRAGRAVVASFMASERNAEALAATIVAVSIRAHRRGLMAIESELDGIADPFLREGLALAVDGTETATLREMLTVESTVGSADDEAVARVFDSAAGYAPTLGILGAVLGLVRVMEHLATPASLGPGIATAFIATVYGVGSANLLLLPLAGRLRERAAAEARRRDIILHGVCAIQDRLHPRLVSQKLRTLVAEVPAIEEVASRLAAKPVRRTKVPA